MAPLLSQFGSKSIARMRAYNIPEQVSFSKKRFCADGGSVKFLENFPPRSLWPATQQHHRKQPHLTVPLLATPDPGTVSKPDQQYWLLPLVLQLSVEVEAAAVEQQPKLFRLSRRTVSSWNVVAMLQKVGLHFLSSRRLLLLKQKLPRAEVGVQVT